MCRFSPVADVSFRWREFFELRQEIDQLTLFFWSGSILDHLLTQALGHGQTHDFFDIDGRTDVLSIRRQGLADIGSCRKQSAEGEAKRCESKAHDWLSRKIRRLITNDRVVLVAP